MTTPTTQHEPAPAVEAPDTERQKARKRLEGKRKFFSDLLAYVLVNAFLIVAWSLGDSDYFWPAWVLGGWGVLLLLDAYRVFLRAPISEADVDKELNRRRYS